MRMANEKIVVSDGTIKKIDQQGKEEKKYSLSEERNVKM